MNNFWEMYLPGLVPVFILSSILILLMYLYIDYKLNYWKRKGVYQLPNTSKLFGDFKDGILFRTSPGCHLGEIYDRTPSNEPYVGFYIFHKPCLLLRDPEVIKQIFIRDFNHFPNRHFAGPPQKDSLGMTNLFGVRNPAWKYMRQKITPRFTRLKLKQSIPMMMSSAKLMMSYLKNNIHTDEKPKYVDVQSLNDKYTADLFADMVLGIKTDSFTGPNTDYLVFWMRFFHSFKRMITLFRASFIPNIVNREFGSPVYFDSSAIRKIFWNSIELREKSGVKRGDIIDEFIELKNGEQDPVYPFVGDNLFFQSGNYLGFESSSTTAAFTLMELARNKKYQDLARKDIKDATDKHGWTLDAFNEMKYLDQCINEALRMYPSVPLLDREALLDYNIPNTDVCIEKGIPVYISLYGLHYDPRYFDEPEVYNPERFGDDRVIPDAYMPFGVGPRGCIGSTMGVLHVKVVVSMILSVYEVYQQPADVSKLDSRFTFITAANGIHLKFTKSTE